MSIRFDLYRYAALHVRPLEYYVHRYLRKPDDEKADITVSLSTIPSRMEKIYPALKSLMDQSLPPRRICLAVPPFSIREQKAYALPARLAHCPAIEIVDAAKDWGPATKLMPVLLQPSTKPGEIILTADDDNIYPARFVETFWQYSRKFPDSALSLRGWSVPQTCLWKDCRAVRGDSLAEPLPADVLNGCGGILVKPKFFTAEFFDYENAPAQAFFVDDIWISGHLAKRNIPRYILPLPGSPVYLATLTTLFARSLDKGENKGGRNDEVIMAYFRPYWRASSESC